MANQEQYDILVRGVEMWNHWRARATQANTYIRPDLHAANLSGAILNHADLSGADLSRATLVETNFAEATLTDCHIYGISAWNVELKGARQNNLVITPEKEPTIAVFTCC